MTRTVRGCWLAVLLWGAFAAGWGQDKPAPLTVWNGKPVSHITKESGISAPRVIHSVEPIVTVSMGPRQKRDAPLIVFVVDTDGVPQNIRFIHSSGNTEFDENFAIAVKQYRFMPAMKDGQPVQVELAMESD